MWAFDLHGAERGGTHAQMITLHGRLEVREVQCTLPFLANGTLTSLLTKASLEPRFGLGILDSGRPHQIHPGILHPGEFETTYDG